MQLYSQLVHQQRGEPDHNEVRAGSPVVHELVRGALASLCGCVKEKYCKGCAYNMLVRGGGLLLAALSCDGGDSDVFLVVYVMMPLY